MNLYINCLEYKIFNDHFNVILLYTFKQLILKKLKKNYIFDNLNLLIIKLYHLI